MKIIVPIICLFFLLAGLQAAWPEQRSPFANLLPEKPEPSRLGPIDDDLDVDISLEDLSVQGVFWGIRIPQVIINGQVYREKDTIMGKDAEIVEIKENTVSILYQGRIFLLSPKRIEE